MSVFHVLKDGSRPKDITGHIVKVEEAIGFYEIIKKVNRRLQDETRNAFSERKEVYTYE